MPKCNAFVNLHIGHGAKASELLFTAVSSDVLESRKGIDLAQLSTESIKNMARHISVRRHAHAKTRERLNFLVISSNNASRRYELLGDFV